MMRIYEYGQVSRDEIFARVEPEVDVTAVVREILADVRAGATRPSTTTAAALTGPI